MSLTEPERPKPLGQHHSVVEGRETTQKLCGAKSHQVCFKKKNKQQNQTEIQATTLKSSLKMLLKRLQEHQTKPRGICNLQNCYRSWGNTRGFPALVIPFHGHQQSMPVVYQRADLITSWACHLVPERIYLPTSLVRVSSKENLSGRVRRIMTPSFGCSKHLC